MTNPTRSLPPVLQTLYRRQSLVFVWSAPSPLWTAWVMDPDTISTSSPFFPPPFTYLIDMDVEEVLLVVHSLDEPLQLANGPAVHHQHVGDAHRVAGGHLLQPALIPLDHRADLACMRKRGLSATCWLWLQTAQGMPLPYHTQQGTLARAVPSVTLTGTCWERRGALL